MYVIYAGATLTIDDILDENVPHADEIRREFEGSQDEFGMILDGGTCIAGPDGQWIMPPQLASKYTVTPL